MEMIHEIPTENIDPHPTNRDEFDQQKTSDMEDSLRQNGQLTPAMVRPMPNGRLQLIAGERRWRGCVAVGIPTLRAVIRHYNDEQALEILIWENLERENVNELQEARMYQALMDMKDEKGRNIYTLEKIAEKRFGDTKKLSRVARILKLNALPEVMKKALRAGQIKARLAFLVSRLADPVSREQAAIEVLNDPYGTGAMTVDKAAAHIAQKYQVSVKGAPFDKESSTILSDEVKQRLGFTGGHGEPNDSSCERCPWLARNNAAFEGELAVKSKDGKSQPGIDPQTCTFATCHQEKLEALWRLKAVPFAKQHGVPLESIRAKKDGGVNFIDGTKDKGLYLTHRLNTVRVVVAGHIDAWQIGLTREQMPSKVPTWADAIQGADVPMEVIAGPNGEPVLIADKALATMAGKRIMPALFAAADTGLKKSDMNSEELAEHEAAEKAAAEEKKRETTINEGTKNTSIRMLMDKIRENGPGLIMVQSLCRAAIGTVENAEDLIEWWYGKAKTELHELDYEALCEHLMEGLGINDLWALLTLMLVCDDLKYSWGNVSRVRDFEALCAEYRVELTEVRKKVTKDYDAEAKRTAAEIKAKDKPKMKSRGKNTDAAAATELANEELVRESIIEQGDKEREAMPSRVLKQEEKAAEVIHESYRWKHWLDQMLNGQVLVSAPNENGVFVGAECFTIKMPETKGKHLISVTLATDAEGGWYYGFDWSRPDDGHSGTYASSSPPLLRERNDSRVQAVERVLSELLADFGEPHLEVAELLIGGCLEEMSQRGLLPQDADEEPCAEMSFEDQVKQIAEGKCKPSDFIGPKPNKQKDAEKFRAWDSQRKKLMRSAEKLKKAA